MCGVDDPFDEIVPLIQSSKLALSSAPIQRSSQKGAGQRLVRETFDEILLNINKTKGPQRVQHYSFGCCTGLPS